MTTITIEHKISAVIGYWRMGATEEEIEKYTGISQLVAKEIIADYQRQLKQKKE